MYSVSGPRITYGSEFRNNANPFRDKFGALPGDEWEAIWLSTKTRSYIKGIEFPAIPVQKLQSQIHGASSGEISTREAFAFYKFVKASGSLNGAHRFLDFGCGWVRMTRPFMRDFDLDKLFGFEPNSLQAIISRALNPFSPDGSLPKNWFDLIVGWSIFLHLSEASLREWLQEISAVLRPGGHAVFTIWGLRFLQRLHVEQTQFVAGKEIHWYSKKCLDGAGDVSKRILNYENGGFVWFTYTQSKDNGEAFVCEKASMRIIWNLGLPVEVTNFVFSSLAQDIFILRRLES